MRHRGDGISGAFDHYFYFGMPYQSMPVITYMGCAVYGCVKAGGGKPFFGPSDVCKVGFRGIWRKIDDANNVNSGQAQGLCKNMDPNLPAPMTPMRIGLLSSARF